MLNLVIAEAALEIVPEHLRNHPSVRSDSRRRDVDASRILLDRSVHHGAMLKLEEGFKRGRPDLVHLTLLNITSSPLHQDGLVKVFIHTRDDVVLDFERRTRPPKGYERFRSLMENLLTKRPREGLIRVYDSSIKHLVRTVDARLSVGFSIQGVPVTLRDVAGQLSRESIVLIGGFPRGHFRPSTVEALDRLVRIDDRALDAHVVAARLVYEVERCQR